ncbi:MAG: geranylgeranylglyceryl/heptaprenylglyceryl phosphate synthase [Aureibaculum sp.]|nr:geranylgeranylglyceryl/heptaprenylglyceryl phosphate synthase [Aureibaculum sp.]
MINSILQHITKSKERGKKLLAILLDPDKVNLENLPTLANNINNKIDFIFVGGSNVSEGVTENLVRSLKQHSSLPIVIFPGDHTQITDDADAILFLSLLSGDNPEYLINQQIKSVPLLHKSQLEIIPTGYILINGGNESSVQKVSNTRPIENTNIELAVNTAIAGMYMGKQLIYLEAGSGARNPVPMSLIKKVSENLTIPLLVGGGIRTQHQLENAFKNGADVVVIGTVFEENNEILDTIIS